ncbi:hypothetical protein Bpfe_010380 [Biomphalaria pfeifferi]|nr:hypothetical protein Bpfe_010379 [Biomphalaria pfeifferi]KAK0060193.1 hypothetical protein Bpfe_010380 [Biomphalaria pfeifferi]
MSLLLGLMLLELFIASLCYQNVPIIRPDAAGTIHHLVVLLECPYYKARSCWNYSSPRCAIRMSSLLVQMLLELFIASLCYQNVLIIRKDAGGSIHRFVVLSECPYY